MKVTQRETLYHEDHGATLMQKCGKRIVTLPLLSFMFFCGLLWPLFFIIFHLEFHPDLWGNHSLHNPFLTWDNALLMMIITLLFLQLKNYNSILRTK